MVLLLLSWAGVTVAVKQLYFGGIYENTTKRRVAKASIGFGVVVGALSMAHFLVT